MKKLAIALCALLLLAGCGSDAANNSAQNEQNTNQQAEAQAEEKQTEPDVPAEYQAALKSAENYAKMMNMSKKGIYEQLTSEYGDQFPEEAAQYAVDHLEGIDWNKNALESAKNYRETMSMSNQAIYEQLIADAGDKFTPEEAQYAVDNLPQ